MFIIQVLVISAPSSSASLSHVVCHLNELPLLLTVFIRNRLDRVPFTQHFLDPRSEQMEQRVIILLLHFFIEFRDHGSHLRIGLLFDLNFFLCHFLQENLHDGKHLFWLELSHIVEELQLLFRLNIWVDLC